MIRHFLHVVANSEGWLIDLVVGIDAVGEGLTNLLLVENARAFLHKIHV